MKIIEQNRILSKSTAIKIQITLIIVLLFFLTPSFSQAFGGDEIKQMLSGKYFYEWGMSIFRGFMNAANSIINTDLTSHPIYSMAETMRNTLMLTATVLANLFLYISIIKENVDLRHNFTLEIFVLYMIKFIFINFVLLNLTDIISWFCDLSGAFVRTITGDVDLSKLYNTDWDETFEDIDWEELLVTFFMGLIYCICCVICGILILWSLYSVYFKIYFYIVISPLALATITGTQGISQSAVSWIKTFLCAICETGGMMVVLQFGSVLIQGMAFDFGNIRSTWPTALQAIIGLVIVTGSVKGVDAMIRRAFGF